MASYLELFIGEIGDGLYAGGADFDVIGDVDVKNAPDVVAKPLMADRTQNGTDVCSGTSFPGPLPCSDDNDAE